MRKNLTHRHRLLCLRLMTPRRMTHRRRMPHNLATLPNRAIPPNRATPHSPDILHKDIHLLSPDILPKAIRRRSRDMLRLLHPLHIQVRVKKRASSGMVVFIQISHVENYFFDLSLCVNFEIFLEGWLRSRAFNIRSI